MAVNLNGGYIEEIDVSKLTPENAIGVCDENMRKASAILTDAKETVSFVESEITKEEGAANHAKYEEAGAIEVAKLEEGYLDTPKAKGSTEGQVYGEMATHATGIAALEVAKSGYELLSRGKDPAAGHGLGPGVKTMHDMTSLKGKGAGGLGKIKTQFIEDMPEGILGRVNIAGSMGKNKMPNQDAAAMGSFKMGDVKKALEVNMGPANEAKFARAQAIKQELAPGMGSGGSMVAKTNAHTLDHDSLGNGPKFKEEDWA